MVSGSRLVCMAPLRVSCVSGRLPSWPGRVRQLLEVPAHVRCRRARTRRTRVPTPMHTCPAHHRCSRRPVTRAPPAALLVLFLRRISALEPPATLRSSAATGGGVEKGDGTQRAAGGCEARLRGGLGAVQRAYGRSPRLADAPGAGDRGAAVRSPHACVVHVLRCANANATEIIFARACVYDCMSDAPCKSLDELNS